MSPKPIAPDADLVRLQDLGLKIEVSHGHLVVHSVPYVTSSKEVARGMLVTNLAGSLGALGRPPDHQVWMVGEYPCYPDGRPIESIRNQSGELELWPGFVAQHRFSSKPFGKDGFERYSDKMLHYIQLISPAAAAVDPNATPNVVEPLTVSPDDSVFRYWDSASSRAGILSLTAKLAQRRIAIVGLGGTGSYVLDLLAKTPVGELHLFDGDVLDAHNVFRAPGAATLEELLAKPSKVDYYAQRYDALRAGIVPHQVFITDANLQLLDDFDFVFICVDKAPVHRLIGSHLRARQRAFVDVGMDLAMTEDGAALRGTCRATLCTPQKSDHFDSRVPRAELQDGNLYGSNIQVADMNMLNAVLAVQQWKKHLGFYLDHWQPHHTTYSLDAHSLTRDEYGAPPASA